MSTFCDDEAPLKWEFLGGKIEPDESKGDCLQREIKEDWA
ncbi:NUDIX domain-containing protein [Sphingobacterium faecium]|nr:NUDIX domain-containing protein [Sphingobacterium faecium]